MKRFLIITASTIVLVVVILFGLEGYASERGEVVVLHTHDASGAAHDTRLWVVDHDGSAWLRAGGPESGWYQRVAADPAISVTRGAIEMRYRATPVPEQRAVINQLMRAKYGWGDQFIGWMIGGRETAIPVRLEPL
jgi:F420H(2)-dependent quinone reductase